MIYIVLGIAIALVVAWNAIPQFRDRLRGWSTIAEGAIGAALTYFGIFADAIEEASVSGYIPDNWASYVPFVLLGWIVMKRLQTSTPVGGK